VLADGTGLQVRDAAVVEFLLAAHTDYVMEWPTFRRDVDPVAESRQTLQKANAKSFQALKQAHIADHRELFDRVTLALPAPAERANLPTDERLIAYNEALRDGEDQGGDPGFEALVFRWDAT